MLIKGLGEKRWMIMNGGIKRDEEVGWTYMRERGKSVIDYILGEEEIRVEMGY